MTAAGTDAVNQGRLVSLDATRGVAVMGILAMNIIAFSMPEMAYITPAAYAGETIMDQIAWAISFLFLDGKLRGLFSLLFGASMLLVVERAEMKGEDASRVHFRRMFWLAILGLFHYFFIWWGDILFLYAAIGCAAFMFRDWDSARLIRWAVGLYICGLLIYSASLGSVLFLQWEVAQPGADPASLRELAKIMSDPDLDLAGHVQAQLELYRGGYGPIMGARFADWAVPFSNIVDNFFETLPLMMIGMALYKNGFLTGDWRAAAYHKLLWPLMIMGLIMGLLMLWAAIASGYDLIIMLNIAFGWSLVPRLLLTVAYAASLMLLVKYFAGTAILRRIAATGRTAFTNYLGSSIVMTGIFYGYGIGLFGELGRIQLWVFVLGGWAAMLIWSKPWLERYHYGPLEWLWRSLARGGFQPMRRLPS